MSGIAFGFLTGILTLFFLFLHLSFFPWIIYLTGIALLFIITAIICFYQRTLSIYQFFFMMIASGLLGFCWALFRIHIVSWQLPSQLENNPITVTGTIASTPESQKNGVRFELMVQRFENPKIVLNHPVRVRLSWYQTAPRLYEGDVWQLSIRLKRPQGLSNPGGFDTVRWLFAQKISATGYINNKGQNQFLSRGLFKHPIDNIRQDLAQFISYHLQSYPLQGLITALAVGTRDNITQDQWGILRATGTNHLFAIAGLHLGFVTTLVFFMSGYLWRRSPYLCLRWPVQQAAAVFGLLAALVYSALAGFSLPTQRALIMMSVYLLAKIARRNITHLNAFNLALLGVLILDPLSVLSQSFWLSFVAVMLIIYGIGGRFKPQTKIWHWLRLQWVLAMGLLPISLLFFQQSSLAGFIANTLAIPWVGFIVLPLCVLGDLSWPIFPSLSSFIFIAAEKLLTVLWWILTYIANQNGLQWYTAITHNAIFVAAMMSMMLLLAPKGFPARYLCIIGWLPLLFWMPAMPEKNAVWVTMLDVGKGLAVIIRTQHHVLLYDTGPGSSEGISAADRVIIPYLRQSHINSINELIISQTNSSYAGGIADIFKQFPVEHVLTTTPSMFAANLATQCMAGQNWRWDNITFRVLYPLLSPTSDKDFCLLQIEDGVHRILIMDNLTPKTARDLLAQKLSSPDILIAPVNNAKTPKILQLLQSLKPQYFLTVSANDNKAVSMPDMPSIFYNTQAVGAITFKVSEVNSLIKPELTEG